jgi:hypothetical protein
VPRPGNPIPRPLRPRRVIPALAGIASLFLLLGGPLVEPSRAGGRVEAEAAFREGNRLYDTQEYAAALNAYREVLKKGYASPELFLNLGNAAYRIGEPGWAAYYYEQAIRRAPADPDIRSNLEQARREALGEEPDGRESRFLERVVALQNRLTLRGAVVGAVILLWAAAGLVVFSWLGFPSRWTRIARWSALTAALVAACLLFTKAAQSSLSAEALIVRPCTAHAEPSPEATVEFRLPGASPVHFGRDAPGWREVIVSSSLRGWVRDEDVASFAAPR